MLDSSMARKFHVGEDQLQISDESSQLALISPLPLQCNPSKLLEQVDRTASNADQQTPSGYIWDANSLPIKSEGIIKIDDNSSEPTEANCVLPCVALEDTEKRIDSLDGGLKSPNLAI